MAWALSRQFHASIVVVGWLEDSDNISMLTDKELMAIQIDALFRQDANSRLLSINEPGNEPPAPRMFLGRTRDGNLWRFRADLPLDLVADLDALCINEPVESPSRKPPLHLDEYTRLLRVHSPGGKQSAGPAYYFNEIPRGLPSLVFVTEADADLLREGFEDLIDELPDYQPFVALVQDGRAVSVCRSVRITSAAHEAGVETLSEFRRRGYATEVVAGWSQAVTAIGAIPLYSTSWENTASQGVAAKLGLTMYGVDFQIS